MKNSSSFLLMLFLVATMVNKSTSLQVTQSLSHSVTQSLSQQVDKSTARRLVDPLTRGPVKSKVWQLVSMRGRPLPTDAVTLTFHPESHTLRGLIACNRYFADYAVRDPQETSEGTGYTLKITDINAGDIQCPEGDMALQQRYLALLRKADRCLLTPYTLTLFQGGKELLKFELQ